MTKEEIDVLEDPKIDEAIKELLSEGKKLVLINDDVNSFDHVIMCLMRYCEHSLEQAEQCAMITHTRGKCVIKTGEEIKLVAIFAALTMNKLTVDIQ